MNQRFNTLDDAIALAKFAHRNQADKAGFSYIDHPLRVLKRVREWGAKPYVQIAAVLHDVTEDTEFTPGMLIDLGVHVSAVDIVQLLDRNISERWYERERANYNIACAKSEFYYLNIRKNPGALQVKLADIKDNLREDRLSYLPEETQDRLRAKYDKALKLLLGY